MAGNDGNTVLSYTPSIGTQISKGPQRPFFWIIQMLVPGNAVGKVMGRGRSNVDNIHKYELPFYYTGQRDCRRPPVSRDDPGIKVEVEPAKFTHVIVAENSFYW
nr:hypothetical protein [Tanacetum cinerariifolium]